MLLVGGRMRVAVGLMVVCLLGMGMTVGLEEEEGDVIRGAVHVITNTECKEYFSYQSLALLHSIKKVGQPGNFTRLVSCSEENLEEFSKEDLEEIPSYIAPDAVHNLNTGDLYLPYNKPASIMHWLEHVKPKEEWILVVDPDMYFRHPLLPDKLQIQEGWMLAMHYNYLSGVANKLAEVHVPQVAKRLDTYAGPLGRRADQVGCFYLIRRKDLERVAPLWYKYTEDVRENPEAWRYVQDNAYDKGKPWIAEMYGMIFAMAHIGLKGVVEPTFQVYPNFHIHDTPLIVHYGLKNEVLDYEFDKKNYYDFDAFQCPSSNQDSKTDQGAGGLFPHPPYPHELLITPYERRYRYGKLLVIEAVNTMNQAMCERHKQKCEESPELLQECGVVDAIAAELVKEFEAYDGNICQDTTVFNCREKAEAGECITDWMQMSLFCRQACGLCSNCSFSTTDGQFNKEERAVYNSKFSLFKRTSRPEELGPFLEEKQLQLLCLNVRERNPKCNLLLPKNSLSAEKGEPSLWPSIIMLLILGGLFVLWRNHKKKRLSKGRYNQ